MRPRARVWLVVAALVAAAGAVLLLWRGPSGPLDPPLEGADPAPEGPAASVERAGPLADRVGLRHPGPGDAVTPPVVVAGEAPGGWYFEADFPLRLEAEDGRVLADSFATARGAWMVDGPVPFDGALRFAPTAEARDARLVLRRANASGLPEHEASVRIPVRLAGPEAALVHFPNRLLDPEAEDCRRVYPVVRSPYGTDALRPAGGAGSAAETGRASPAGSARALLEVLLAGPTERERAAGYRTAIPEDAGVRSVSLRDGTLRVDFDRGMSRAAGSCLVRAIRAQVEATLGRLPGVRVVEIAVEGSVAEALQP